MDALTATATDYGLTLLNSTLKNKATSYTLIGAQTHDAQDVEIFYSSEIETSYYDDNGVLTFIIELPIEPDFDRYLYSVSILDDTQAVVVNTPTPRMAMAKGVGGMLTIKVAVTGEAGTVVFRAHEYVTETELNERLLAPLQQQMETHAQDTDPHTIYALKTVISELLAEKASSDHTHPAATEQEAGVTTLSSSTSSDSETQAATSKAVKLVMEAIAGINDASITESGIVQLSNSLSSDSQTIAATSLAVKSLHDALKQMNSLILVGVPIPWPSSVVPTGFLQMRGQSFDPVAYPQLAILYPTHILNDMRAEVIRGWDDGRGVDTGRVLLSHQADQLKSHNHSRPYRGSAQAGSDNGGAPVGASTGYGTGRRASGTGSTGGNETRMRNIAFNYITRAA